MSHSSHQTHARYLENLKIETEILNFDDSHIVLKEENQGMEMKTAQDLAGLQQKRESITANIAEISQANFRNGPLYPYVIYITLHSYGRCFFFSKAVYNKCI